MKRSPAALPCWLALSAAGLGLAPAALAQRVPAAANQAQAAAPTAELAAQRCAAHTDAAQRLACYDAVFRTRVLDPLSAPATPVAAPDVSPAATLSPSAAPASEADRTAIAPPPASTATAMPSPGSALSTFWELGRSDKRKAFVVRTFYPNYLLPLHLSSDINRQPISPTRGAAPLKPNYKAVEAKMQISLRVKVAEDLLLPRADLWATYTQRSMWQVWNQADSAPFRNTDYQPELKYVVPVPDGLSVLPSGWSWRMLEAGFAHQSNGQSEPLSRSWNRLYAGTAFEKGEMAVQMRFNRRPREGSKDDNPDLTRYIGNTEIQASWLPGQSTASLTWRLHPKEMKRGSVQLDWTYPVDSQQPQGLRWYLQLFSGYGESLLDYNHRQTSLGLGLTLFQF
jgi:phospholipase A1/A2